jgi:hypothetical protein
MLERESDHHARLQMPLAQLTHLVAGALGVKSAKITDWLTGYALAREKESSSLPKHLQRDLDMGLSLSLVSQPAYDALTM